MSANAFLQAHIRQLAENLRLRLGVAVTEGYTTDGLPTLSTAGIYVRAKQTGVHAGTKNSLGIEQRVFRPSVLSIVVQQDATQTSITTVPVATLLPVIGELVKTGIRVELHLSADATLAEADIDATPAAVFDSLYHPLTGSI
jgi:hypothetical protein